MYDGMSAFTFSSKYSSISSLYTPVPCEFSFSVPSAWKPEAKYPELSLLSALENRNALDGQLPMNTLFTFMFMSSSNLLLSILMLILDMILSGLTIITVSSPGTKSSSVAVIGIP